MGPQVFEVEFHRPVVADHFLSMSDPFDSLDAASTASVPLLGENALQSEVLSVRSRISSF